jgi:signal transduction histidine kinase
VKWGESTLEEEIDLEPAGMKGKTILCSAVPLRDQQQKITGAIMVTQEITERKKMEMELAEVQRRLMDGIESERRRLAQELHDGPMQDLYGIEFHLKAMATDAQGELLRPGLADTNAAVQDVIGVLRDICGDLRPPALVHFGLKRAILSHIEKFILEHPDIQVDLDLASDHNALPEPVRMALFRIYQHILSNIARHARATRVGIHFHQSEEVAILEISDNGVGFRLPRKVELAREGHLGLIGSSERAESVGGHLTIDSRPGAGTTIRAEVPLHPERAVPAEATSEAA